MSRRRKLHLLIIDKSVLARNMYALLFANPGAYFVNYADSVDKLKKLKTHEKPDVLVLNSNVIGRGEPLNRGKMPTLLLCSPDRLDLKDEYEGEHKDLILVEKPFYPYNLLSWIHSLAQIKAKKAKPRKSKGTKRGQR